MEATATITFGAPEKVETSDRQLSPVDAAAVDALPAGTRSWSCSAGRARAAGSCSTSTSCSAGRHPESEIFLDDVTVSRRHAEFHRSGDAFTVRDAGSLNGTYVNRDRIDNVDLQRR